MSGTRQSGTEAPVRAVIFDMDGVLVDSEPLLFEAERILLAELGAELTEEIKRPFIGMGGHEVLQALLDHFGLEADVAALGKHKGEIYLELARTVPGFAPTAELARALHADGIPLAIASGSTPEGIAICLAAIGLTEEFPVQVSVSSVARGKPAPDVFLAAAERLGIPPTNCLVVEDAIHGVDAAHAAGMRVIAIPSVTDPLDPGFSQADLLVPGGITAADSAQLIVGAGPVLTSPAHPPDCPHPHGEGVVRADVTRGPS